jgi:two-component system response regulator MprA
MTHVLIAEDSEEDRQLLKKLLELNGYRVTAVGNGQEALAAARSYRPDAIISDVAMPKMDGYILCHTWMLDTELKTIPFIFYTGKLISPEDEHVALVLGAARHLIKPMRSEAFLQALRTVLQEWAEHSLPRM